MHLPERIASGLRIIHSFKGTAKDEIVDQLFFGFFFFFLKMHNNT